MRHKDNHDVTRPGSACVGCEPDKTPMERDYPTICEWTRHGAVSTAALEAELRKALGWVSGKDVVLLPRGYEVG